jgi:hypothetical protein
MEVLSKQDLHVLIHQWKNGCQHSLPSSLLWETAWELHCNQPLPGVHIYVRLNYTNKLIFFFFSFSFSLLLPLKLQATWECFFFALFSPQRPSPLGGGETCAETVINVFFQKVTLSSEISWVLFVLHVHTYTPVYGSSLISAF